MMLILPFLYCFRVLPPLFSLLHSRFLFPTFSLTFFPSFYEQATSTFTAVSALFLYSRNLPLPPQARLGVNLLMGVACCQVGLGIATLLYMVPVSLGTAHQAGSLTLLTSALYLMHSLKKVPVLKKIPLK